MGKAFDFKRKFDYMTTVNWKFIPEDLFGSDLFSRSLLVLHAFALIIFLYRTDSALKKKFHGKKMVLDAQIDILLI
jgi:alpha-1,3-mannosyltransferase